MGDCPKNVQRRLSAGNRSARLGDKVTSVIFLAVTACSIMGSLCISYAALIVCVWLWDDMICKIGIYQRRLGIWRILQRSARRHR